MRNKLLIAAAVLVVLASVAYAAFSQVLNINGTGTASGSWQVKITDIDQVSSSGATDASAPTFTDTTATFDVNLAYPGATATYDVTIENSGTIDAKVSRVTGIDEANSATPAYITYGFSGVDATTTITANGGTNVAKVTVTWDPNSAPVTAGASKTATIKINYVQDTP